MYQLPLPSWTGQPHDQTGKWSGRDQNKDAVRGEVWDLLDTGGHAMGPAWDFVQDDQFDTIPFPRDMRDRMTSR